ncbi:MAG: hypothetical protein KF875_11350 [Trueperaceae bacterium]|nr:hypothetical protein [Trueperaceae bacterium]
MTPTGSPTLIERRLGAPAGREVDLAVDLIVTDDWTTPSLLPTLSALGTVRSAAPLVLVRDHTGPADTYVGAERDRVLALRQVEEEFAVRFGAERITGQGIQHHALPASGRLRPGMLVLGNDSHTPTLGAHGVTAFAAQPTTLAVAIHTGRFVVRVPETVHVRVVGRLRGDVTARDAALTLLDLLRGGGSVPRLATGRALEFGGPGLARLTSAERAVLANVTPEAVAVTAVFSGEAPPQRSGTVVTLDLAQVLPSVARSGQPSDVVPLARLGAVRVDRVFVGTCAGGTYEEIAAFAAALGARAAIPTVVAPASTGVLERLSAEGIARRLEDAGVTLLAPGCGPCFGFGMSRLEDDEVAVVTGNRNSVGRMGSPHARIVLAAGRTAGQAASTGWLNQPAATGGGGASAANEPRGADTVHADRDAGARTVRAGRQAEAALAHTDRAPAPTVVWPTTGNVVRLLGLVSTDDLTPSSVPGVGTSSDADPRVARRLLLHHVDPSAADRSLEGTVLVGDENFGMGSNRASSIRALVQAGVRAVIAPSIAPLYASGARDEGLPAITLADEAFYGALTPEALLELDLAAGTVTVRSVAPGRPAASDLRRFRFAPAGPHEAAVLAAGGAVPYLRGPGGCAMASRT